MYQKERLDKILSIVRHYGYVTVKYLVAELHYSNATVNRDLNCLEAQKLVHRTYGGVEAVEKKGVPIRFRYHKMKSAKLKIAKKAAELIKDGEIIFIDASTTAESMLEFLTQKKNIKVLTNNVSLVMRLSEAGISVVCLGGDVVESPCMLDGEDTVLAAMRYRAQKAFFSTGFFTKDGKIGSAPTYHLLHTVMVNNSMQSYFLADHEKLDAINDQDKFLFDFSKLSGVISDYEFDEEIKRKYPNTDFYKV